MRERSSAARLPQEDPSDSQRLAALIEEALRDGSAPDLGDVEEDLLPVVRPDVRAEPPPRRSVSGTQLRVSPERRQPTSSVPPPLPRRRALEGALGSLPKATPVVSWAVPTQSAAPAPAAELAAPTPKAAAATFAPVVGVGGVAPASITSIHTQLLELSPALLAALKEIAPKRRRPLARYALGFALLAVVTVVFASGAGPELFSRAAAELFRLL